MNISIFIKSIIAFFLYRRGWIDSKLKQLAKSSYLIITYHRILSDAELLENVEPGMYVELETFKNHIKWLTKWFDIIPLEESTAAESKNTLSNDRHICSLTFDDGWRDFYDVCFPVLKKYSIPATVFLPTGYIGTTKQFWTDRFAYILESRALREVEIPYGSKVSNLAREILALRGSLGVRLANGIKILKSYPIPIINEILDEVSEILQLAPPERKRVFLSWDEVHEMHDSGIITFGSHTQNHQILTTLTEDEIQYELTSSKEDLLRYNVVDSSFIPFCYPNGNYSKKIAEMVRRAGYHLAATTRGGWNDASASPFELKRVSVHQDISSTEPMFMCRLSTIA